MRPSPLAVAVAAALATACSDGEDCASFCDRTDECGVLRISEDECVEECETALDTEEERGAFASCVDCLQEEDCNEVSAGSCVECHGCCDCTCSGESGGGGSVEWSSQCTSHVTSDWPLDCEQECEEACAADGCSGVVESVALCRDDGSGGGGGGAGGAGAGGCGDLASCEGTCNDLAYDHENCGACGNACDPFWQCVGGSCVRCPPPLADCGGEMCAHLSLDPQNCGACGNACAGARTCDEGVCRCIPVLEECGGECVPLDSDPQNCGACGSVCARSCNAGVCS